MGRSYNAILQRETAAEPRLSRRPFHDDCALNLGGNHRLPVTEYLSLGTAMGTAGDAHTKQNGIRRPKRE